MEDDFKFRYLELSDMKLNNYISIHKEIDAKEENITRDLKSVQEKCKREILDIWIKTNI